jgi:hypothetical protein
MPFQKGKPKTGGKKPGTQNKATRDIKEAYRMLIEKNLNNLTGWLEIIADENPEKAIRILSDLSEYVIPKLARKELTGKDGEELIPPTIIFVRHGNRNTGK